MLTKDQLQRAANTTITLESITIEEVDKMIDAVKKWKGNSSLYYDEWKIGKQPGVG